MRKNIVLNNFFKQISLETLKSLVERFPNNLVGTRRLGNVDIQMDVEFAEILLCRPEASNRPDISQMTGSLGFASAFDYGNYTDEAGRLLESVDLNTMRSAMNLELLVLAILRREVKEASRSLKNLFKDVVEKLLSPVLSDSNVSSTYKRQIVDAITSDLDALNYVVDGRQSFGRVMTHIFPLKMEIVDGRSILTINDEQQLTIDDVAVVVDDGNCTVCDSPTYRIDQMAYCTNAECPLSFENAMAQARAAIQEDAYTAAFSNQRGIFTNTKEVKVTLFVEGFVLTNETKAAMLHNNNQCIGYVDGNSLTTRPLPMDVAESFIQKCGLAKSQVHIINLYNIDDINKNALMRLVEGMNVVGNEELIIHVDDMRVERPQMSTEAKFSSVFQETSNGNYSVTNDSITFAMLGGDR